MENAAEADGVLVFLGLGSNIGDRETHLRYALDRLSGEATVTGLSGVYETDPVGFADQRPFLNMVVRLRTTRSPRALLELTRTIETGRGRTRTIPHGPRTLDVDILLYGGARISTAGLEVPHPRMTERAFVLVPLLELDPELREPGTGRPYATLLPARPAGVRRLYDGENLLEKRD